MQPGATARAEEDAVIIAFTGSREVGNIAWNAPNDIAAPAQPEPDPAPVFPSLKLVAFREAEN